MTDEPKVVKAEPTKSFFIEMLVRDIGLVPAIVDLVDNSVDGARRLRPTEQEASGPDSGVGADADSGRFAGLWVNIRFEGNAFEITDNCGGIPWAIARDYAFRFGRPDEAPGTAGSIGQFGIGMKRALFKLGDGFEVSSRTADESFELTVNVKEWAKSKEWVFPGVAYEEGPTAVDEQGTSIRVAPLHSEIEAGVRESRFLNSLITELSRAHQGTLIEGLAISVNGIPINVDVQTLINSDELKPVRIRQVLDEDSRDPVRVEIIAGVDASSPADAGWYVYCNGRLILGPDRSIITGWGEGNGKTLPQYHNQFARFKGYVFFESSDVTKLPWTTTKSGVDQGHWVYRATRPRILEVARPIINFLNALAAEKDTPVPGAVSLEGVVARAEDTGSRPISTLAAQERFVAPTRAPLPRKPETQSIQFVRPIKEINRLKKILSVSSAREVGEAAFDSFYRREFGDGE